MNRQQVQDKIVAALQNGCGNHQTITLTVGNGKATCCVLQADALAGSFSSLKYVSAVLNQLAGQELTRFADALAARLTYLMEPISTVEADPEVVQLRSDPPSQEGDRTRCYFELLARTGSLNLVRYRKLVGEPRKLVPMQLTHEVLARLLIDFDSAAASL